MENPAKKILDIKEVEKDVKGSSTKVVHEKQKTLRRSMDEGAAASVATGTGDSYITPFADVLGAQPIHIGLLSAITALASPLAQLRGSSLMARSPRKKIVLASVFLNACMWLVLAAIAIFAYIKTKNPFFILFLIVAYTLLGIFNGLAFPAWYSWMGDLVPEKDRGRYFSKRNVVTGIVSLVTFLMGAFILDFFEQEGIMIGFFILFILAFLFRMLSFASFRKHYAPPLKIHRSNYFSFWQFIKRFDNYGRFSVYLAFFEFAIMVASPFFAVYMLQELGYNQNYLLYTLVAMSSSLFYLLFTPLAGKFSDRYGNARLLVIANVCFIFTPLLWLISKNPIYLIVIPQLVAGIANAAFIIASTNFTYDAVSQEKRGRCIAYTNVLIGLGSFFGAILGGYLLSVLPSNTLSLNKFFLIFILASLLRLGVALVFLPRVEEVRKVERLPPMHVHIAHPFRTIRAEMGWFRVLFRNKS